LQDKVDRRLIRADDKLRPVGSLMFLSNIIRCLIEQFQIFGVEPVIFQKLPEIVNRFLAAPDPIVLHYNLNPTVPPPDRPSAWDVELKVEDSALKNRMAVTVNTSKESAQALLKLDEEVCFFILLLLYKTGLLMQFFPTLRTRSPS
jgi:SWI/SNF-related matrix-associated actin-dependent regulator of chromatin subfamily D